MHFGMIKNWLDLQTQKSLKKPKWGFHGRMIGVSLIFEIKANDVTVLSLTTFALTGLQATNGRRAKAHVFILLTSQKHPENANQLPQYMSTC